MPQHSIVIVLKNGVPDTLRTVQSLIETAEESSFEVVFVDNATTDDTAEVLKAFEGDVKVIRLEYPELMTTAINRGVEQAAGDLVTVFPQGAVFTPGWQPAFTEALAMRDRVKIVGPALRSAKTDERAAIRIAEFVGDSVRSLRIQWVNESQAPELFAAAIETRILAMAGLTFVRSLWVEFGRFDESLKPDLAAADFCLRSHNDKRVYSYLQPAVTFEPVFLETDDNLTLSQWPGAVAPEVTWVRLGNGGADERLDRIAQTQPKVAAYLNVLMDSMAAETPLGELPDNAVEYISQRMAMEQDYRLLQVMRGGRDVCWTDEHEKEPLVTLAIATHTRLAELMERAIPSALNQTYERIEVLVVGDKVDEDMEKHLSSISDPRFRFINLGARGLYPTEPKLLWTVGGVNPMNVAKELATGSWLSQCDDDDEFTPDHVEVLLAAARQNRLEMIWSKALMEFPDGWSELGSTPLSRASITHGSVLYSLGLRFMKLGSTVWKLDEPADWNLWRRMAAIGVVMGFYPAVTYKHYIEGPYREFDAG